MRTPDHHHSQASDIANANFEVLFNCLAVEYRKAGGYFMNFLEKQESKVYINSLLFWREVQEYKALFVGKTFRPCAVERKSKVCTSTHDIVMDIKYWCIHQQWVGG